MGGMRFRQLEVFNNALLAKQICRIIDNPDSLVARVLKARYFKHQDIMDAHLGSNPSYIWRSLLWSRELLMKGLHWRVGNCEKIRTFRDRWVPSRLAQSQIMSDVGMLDTVSVLMLRGAWNETLVLNNFPSYLAQEILHIPLSSAQSIDSRFWTFDPKGKYTVRDGYKVDIGFYDTPRNFSMMHSNN